MTKLPDTDFDSLLPPLVLTRRGFIAGSLATGFALAAGAAVAQTAIKTSSEGLDAGEIRIPTADGEIAGYRAAPAGKTGLPVVLVVQEVFGVHEYIQDVCRRLAHEGYMAVAPELYSPRGEPRKYTEIGKVPDTEVISDLDASAVWAAGHGGDPELLGITGFCWGGRFAWLYAAHNPKVDAGVAWYGRLVGDKDTLHPVQPVEIAARINGPVLGLYGGKDAGIMQDSIDAMKAELAKGPDAAKASEFVVYPEAGHAFHADYRPSYHEDAAKDGWKRALAWFDLHLKK